MNLSGFHVWVEAARPRTLPAAASPVFLGIAMAWSDNFFHLFAACAALLGAVSIQIAANYANDYYDYVKGADTEERLGPRRATQSGMATPAAMRVATMAALGFAVLPGAYLIVRGGWPILAIGLLSMTFAILYTGGPLPLGYIGAADLFVLVFFGPVAVAGAYYVQSLQFSWLPVYTGLAPGLLSVAILTVNNLRDIEQDRRAGKKTLAVRFGIFYVQCQYVIAVVMAVGVIPLSVSLLTGRYWVLVSTLALIPALACIKDVLFVRDGLILNSCLAKTGKVLLLFSLLFSAGWIVA